MAVSGHFVFPAVAWLISSTIIMMTDTMQILDLSQQVKGLSIEIRWTGYWCCLQLNLHVYILFYSRITPVAAAIYLLSLSNRERCCRWQPSTSLWRHQAAVRRSYCCFPRKVCVDGEARQLVTWQWTRDRHWWHHCCHGDEDDLCPVRLREKNQPVCNFF